MRIQAVAASDRGQHRQCNEDKYLIDESLGLYVVCDGMGGHAAGEVAAERSVAFVNEYIRAHRTTLDNAGNSPDGYFRVLQLAEDAAQDVSRRLFEQASSDPAVAGMGTTMTLLLVVDNKAVMAHIGDSRLYIVRRGELHQLSNDHTLANELLQAGGLTREEAANSKYNHVLTRAVGQQESVQVETLLFDLFPGDTCLLCSDGLSNYFQDQRNTIELICADDFSNVPRRLVEFANEQGGSDNITLIALRVTADADEIDEADIQLQIDTLKATFLCRDFPVSRLMRVLNHTSLVECASDQRLLATGQTAEGLYILMRGRLLIQEDGFATEMMPGDCIGECSLLGSTRIESDVVAAEPSSVMFISRPQFSRITRRLPKLGNAMLRNLAQHLSDQLNHLRDESECASDTVTWDDQPS